MSDGWIKTSRVVFLDIDGVLVTKRLLMQREGRKRCADELCVKALNRLTAEGNAAIVVSSSWRFCGQNEMQNILDFWEVHARIIGCTPDLTIQKGLLYKAAKRGDEIQAWLDQHPEITGFVILDDECDMAHLEPFLVKTTFEDGLTDTHVTQALEILNRATSQTGRQEST